MTSHPLTMKEWPLVISPLELLGSIPDAVLATDSQMRINYFSPTAEEITGYKRHEAVGMYCRDVLKSDMCEDRCAVKLALDTDKNVFNIETHITTARNKRIPILISASLLRDRSGNIIGHIYVFRDISELKKIMSELEQSRDELVKRNKKLDEALRELKNTQEQLLHAQKMESIGILAGGFAHDFNNLLSGVLGYASLIKQQITYEHPLFSYVNVIEKSALRASKLTRQLLIFSRQGNFQRKLQRINKVIDDTLMILSRTIDKRIQINTNLAANLPFIKMDESQIEQVLLNLCINASDAMKGSGTLTITTEYIQKDEIPQEALDNKSDAGFVRISISDTGEGIPSTIQNKIFDPFFTTKSKDRGTGLGLSMVYGIVKDHGGFVDFDTKTGKGTTFYVYLPASLKKPADRVESPSDKAEQYSGNETILLVDDEAMIRDLAQTALGSYGYRVLLANDGIEALDIYHAQKNVIDLVVLDLAMPKMNGIETFEAMKAINPSVRAIICSGFSPDINRDSPLKKLGIEAYINKPYRIQELLKIIRSVLEHKK